MVCSHILDFRRYYNGKMVLSFPGIFTESKNDVRWFRTRPLYWVMWEFDTGALSWMVTTGKLRGISNKYIAVIKTT